MPIVCVQVGCLMVLITLGFSDRLQFPFSSGNAPPSHRSMIQRLVDNHLLMQDYTPQSNIEIQFVNRTSIDMIDYHSVMASYAQEVC